MSTSAEFDTSYYLTNNADVVIAISQGHFANALDHYNKFGGKELRAPNATFNPNYYAVNAPMFSKRFHLVCSRTSSRISKLLVRRRTGHHHLRLNHSTLLAIWRQMLMLRLL